MKRYALISEGVVTDLIVAEDMEGLQKVNPKYFGQFAILEVSGEPGSPGIGWLHDGKEFAPPPSPEPQDELAQAQDVLAPAR